MSTSIEQVATTTLPRNAEAVIVRALRDLERYGFDVKPLWREHAQRESARDGGVPSKDDTRWPRVAGEGIDEHLNRGQGAADNTRPVFSCAIVKGRMYTLTSAQRAILREWFNMIPSPEVEIVDIVMWGDTPYFREVIIKTTQLKMRGTIINGPRCVTLDRFGAFMTACATREGEMATQAEIDRLTKRVEKLVKRANEEDVAHNVRSAGSVAYPWHAQIEQKRLVDPVHVREELRIVLLSQGEQGLAKLVREPSFTADDATNAASREAAKQEEFNAFLTSLGINL